MTDLTEVSSTLQRATVLCDLGRYDEAISVSVMTFSHSRLGVQR